MSRRTYRGSGATDPGKSQALHIGGGKGGGRKQKQTPNAKGAVGRGAQELPHGDSGEGNQRWPPRIGIHRQACGKAIRSLFLSLTTNNLILSNRKPQHQHGKGARWGSGAEETGTTATAPQSFLRRPSTQTLSCAKKTTFRKNPLGDLLSIICAG